MITIQNSCIISLPCGVNDIKNFTINHCDFYFLDRSGCKLIKWGKRTQTVETIALDRKYLCICYDPGENCYWAIPESESCVIYRLDACFCEVGHLPVCGACQQHASSLCCDNRGKGIWVCYPSQLAYIDICSEKVTWYKNGNNRKINQGILMQCECRVNCFYEGGRQFIEVVSPCCRESLELCIPKAQKAAGISLCSCKQNENCCLFYVLLSKSCSHEFILTEYSVDFSLKPEEPCCLCPPVPGPCPSPCPHEPCWGGSYEVMHSIALEEAGISHILNAEGEKIQKAVAMSDNIEQLLCVNESVKRTLTQVTLLEGMLYSKLEALVSCDDFCRDTKCPCPPPNPPAPCGECHETSPCD